MLFSTEVVIDGQIADFGVTYEGSPAFQAAIDRFGRCGIGRDTQTGLLEPILQSRQGGRLFSARRHSRSSGEGRSLPLRWHTAPRCGSRLLARSDVDWLGTGRRISAVRAPNTPVRCKARSGVDARDACGQPQTGLYNPRSRRPTGVLAKLPGMPAATTGLIVEDDDPGPGCKSLLR